MLKYNVTTLIQIVNILLSKPACSYAILAVCNVGIGDEMDFQIHKTGNGKSRLTVNLLTHLQAYHYGDNEDLDLSHQLLKDETNESHLKFDELTKEAVRDFNNADINTIKESPAYYFIKKEFAEILKNAIDGKLKPHEQEIVNIDTKLEMDLEIYDNDDGTISIKITDNGSGFPPDKLNQIKDKESRENYDCYHAVGSEKKSQNGRKLLIGGAGRGLRELMGLADVGDANYGQGGKFRSFDADDDITDDKVESLTFTPPDISELLFDNKKGGNETGAIIEVTTSQAPLVFNPIAQTTSIAFALPSKIAKQQSKYKSRESSPSNISDSTEDSSNDKTDSEIDTEDDYSPRSP
ncbi:MAG: ATP-binding protein [Legionellaceae bacterium]|nr:ATP-binding protein [Legionellaceae bacterium]